MYNVIRICILLFLIFVAVLISKINFNETELANCNSLSNLDQKLIDINNFSSFEADLEIDDWRKWQLINIKDLINYDTFNQFTNRTRVSGTINLRKVSGKIINCKLKVALRPHGDQKDHRDGNYLPSLQVKIIDSNLFGITDFLLLRPKQRGYYNEVFVTSLMRSINLLAPRTSMVSINFSNKYNKEKWNLNGQQYIGKQIIIINAFIEQNIQNTINFIKSELVKEKPSFNVKNSSLLFTPLLLQNIDKSNLQELDYDYKYKIAIITSIPHTVKKEQIDYFKKYIIELIKHIETYNSNISCKLIIITQRTKIGGNIELLSHRLIP